MSVAELLPVNWPAAANNSQRYSLQGFQVVGFWTTASLTSTALTFLASMNVDGSNISGITNPGYVTVKTAGNGNDISFTVTTSKYYGFTADQIAAFRGIKHITVAGGSSESAGINVVLAIRTVE